MCSALSVPSQSDPTSESSSKMNPVRIAATAVALLAIVGMAGCSAQSASTPPPVAAPSSASPATTTPTPQPTPAVPDDGGFDQGQQDGYQPLVYGDPVPAGHSPEYQRGWQDGQDQQAAELKVQQAEEAKLIKPYIRTLRESWPKQSKPYSDEELTWALDGLCTVVPSNYWDGKAWNKARMKSVTEAGIENETLKHALLGLAADTDGWCKNEYSGS